MDQQKPTPENDSPLSAEFTDEMANFLFEQERTLNNSLVRADEQRTIHGGIDAIGALDDVRGFVDQAGLDDAFNELDGQ